MAKVIDITSLNKNTMPNFDHLMKVAEQRRVAEEKKRAKREKEMKNAIANGEVRGWSILAVAIGQDGMFVDASLAAPIQPDYEQSLNTLNKLMQNHVPFYKATALKPADYAIPDETKPGEPMGRMYEVDDDLSLGHNWFMPISRFILREGGIVTYMFIKPLM